MNYTEAITSIKTIDAKQKDANAVPETLQIIITDRCTNIFTEFGLFLDIRADKKYADLTLELQR